MRLGSVLHSEIKRLCHPCAAPLGFTPAVLAYNMLALLKALPTGHLPTVDSLQQPQLMEHLSLLAARLKPRQLSSSKRAPKSHAPK